MYRQLVHEITQTFKNISDEILTLQQRLKTDFDCAEAANLIGKVQDDEKLKLEMVCIVVYPLTLSTQGPSLYVRICQL